MNFCQLNITTNEAESHLSNSYYTVLLLLSKAILKELSNDFFPIHHSKCSIFTNASYTLQYKSHFYKRKQ